MGIKNFLILPIYLFLVINVSLSASLKTVVSKDLEKVVFDVTAFSASDDESVLFLGSSNKVSGEYSLARLVLGTNDDGETSAVLEPLASGDKLRNKEISNLVLFEDTLPVVTVKHDSDDSNNDSDDSDTSSSVFLVKDPKQGLSVLECNNIKDATGEIVDKDIVALATSDKYIFSLVPMAGKEFDAQDGVDRGIAILKQKISSDEDGNDEEVLEAINSSNLEDDEEYSAIAITLDVTAEPELAAFADASGVDNVSKALIGNEASMLWDNTLERLYIGLTEVRRDLNTNEGGVLGLSMGYIDPDANDGDGSALRLASIVRNPEKKMFFQSKQENRNVLDGVFGLYFDGKTNKGSGVNDAVNNGEDEVSVSIRNIQSMHTSTGRVYLIVNSVIASNPVMMGGLLFAEAEDWVYALPLIDKENAPQGEEIDVIGTVPRVDADGVPELDGKKKFQLPTDYGHMVRSTHKSISVGGANPVPGSWVKDIFVNGDSVYVTLAGTNNKNRGIFKSTALFNEDGFIIAWTAAERVMGSVSKVFGGGLDTKTGNFYALGGKVNVGQISQWGKGSVGLHGGDEKFLLSSVLEKEFKQEQGGVHQIFSFDENTSGFNKGKFSMMVAVGADKVALIQTGGAKSDGFTPTEIFKTFTTKDEDTTVIVVSNPVLKEIGPLCCAAVVENTTDNKINVFVTGFGGVAKLEIDSKTPLNSLKKSDGNKVVIKITRFKPDDIKEPVYKVVSGRISNNNYVHFMMSDKVLTYKFDGTDKKEAIVTAPFDLIVVRDKDSNNNSFGILASRSGIQVTKDFNSFGSGVNLSGQVAQLQYMSERSDGRPSQPGNLYALVFGKHVDEYLDNEENDDGEVVSEVRETVPQIYRLVVSQNGVKCIDTVGTENVPYLQLDTFRSAIAVDGSLLFNTLPKDSGLTDFVRIAPIIKRKTSQDILDKEQSIFNDLDLDYETNFNVGVIARDAASGAWVIPGDWGIRVNE